MMVVNHQPVAMDFGDNGCGGDGPGERIALDDRTLRQGHEREGDGVEQEAVGRRGQGSEGALHREAGGFQNIQVVDLLRVGRADPNPDRPCQDLAIQSLPHRLGHLFGVVQLVDSTASRKNHGRRDHRAGERSTPGFVQPGHPLEAATLCL